MRYFVKRKIIIHNRLSYKVERHLSGNEDRHD